MKKRRKTFRSKPQDKWTDKDYCDACDVLWSKIIKQEAGHKCCCCGRSKEAGFQLHAHHLIHRSSKFFRHNLNNGVCLCAKCHKMSGSFSAHLTPHKFDKWAENGLVMEQYHWWQKNRYKVMPSVKIDWPKIYEGLRNWQKLQEIFDG